MRLILQIIIFFTFANLKVSAQKPYVLVLGTAQDGGFPQAGCKKECCKSVWENKIPHEGVASLALIDPISKQKWIFDATPDFPEQLHLLNNHTGNSTSLDGIFLTHAHIGHYTGLMHLGREVMGSSKMKVFAMPKMKGFLENNGPRSQLVSIQNIEIRKIEETEVIVLNERIKVVPFRVPHRDEFSETVGYKIMTKDKSLIFIPDIDKWQKWDKNLVDVVKENNVLLLDGTFYKDGEIDRPMSEGPHPFITETVGLLSDLPKNEKNKVKFIHLNHTNPILLPHSKERKDLKMKGFAWVETGQKLEL
ncbi:MBL fold metallo-hydrolase [Lacihabitans soyangensis]|uniref:Pyrroloquinoline quinone biosynthesis protein PqqB n=1 Tax=Lacihabitans soyangensis TaxID=869394 RepID=A0AAE3KS41_9BACT|nr:MBL fold metallo-hydrolase [Lacihabitans soyangensis]MCP9762189.1 pyrroloquinoline quinone biosynthesis protein PqqB [Lacihabitans soyangensis]